MRFSRARYISWCQKSLVTVAVVSVGVSGAGVTTLKIVPQPGEVAGVHPGVPGWRPQPSLTPSDTAQAALAETQVDVAPVTPRVREVRVTGISAKAPAATGDRSARRLEAEPSKELVARSDPQPVTGYATVGVTWKHGVDYADHDIAVQVRTEKDGAWSEWIDAEYHDEHAPNVGSPEVQNKEDRPGTDAVVIGDVDRVQMRAETRDGSTPPELELALIDPGAGTTAMAAPAIDTSKLPDPASATQAAADPSGANQYVGSGGARDTAVLSAMKIAARPYIYSRAQWGANERMRDQSPPSYGTVKTGFIHHTVNANNYTAAQVPALIRGIYAYHTQSRGWRDIGYNYLVDRFGRIWEGRHGGVARAVVGAHTLGYNEVSFAMSAIGNYDIASPPRPVLKAYARLFAWKLSLYDIRADASRLYVKNRYLAAINGHRDTGQTACPGQYLYAKIPYIRRLAQTYQNGAQPAPVNAIMRRWRAIGGYHSVIRGPRGAEYSVAGGRARNFRYGRIYAKDGVGAFELYGKVLKAYVRRGAAASRLGFPRSAPIRIKRGIKARFEKGKLKVFRSGRVKVIYSRR